MPARKHGVREGRKAIGRDLTPREYEVLVLYANLGNQTKVGHVLGLSREMVSQHLNRVYAKLDVTSNIDAFRVIGWLKPPEPPYPY